MKSNNKILTGATRLLAVAGLTIMSARLYAQPPPPPLPPPPPAAAVTVQVPVPPPPPMPGVAVTVGVPENYTWDGSEYVGMVGDNYVYLGPGNVWMPLGADRLSRFHDWERDHHDWRTHAVVNQQYRRDAQGHDYPWHDRDHH